jgi:hypothetical protein
MTEPKPRSLVATVAWWIGGIFVALALYVASVGPAWVLVIRTRTADELPQWFSVYDPIFDLARGNPRMEDFLNDYLNWWIGIL